MSPHAGPEAPAGTNAEAPAGTNGQDEAQSWSGPPAPEPAAPRSRRRWWITAAGIVVVAGAVAASWFALPIRTVEVSGHSHLSAQQVRALAGLSPGFGWLYYGGWRARGLLRDPWIRSARLTRRFPSTVTVNIRERQPVARWQQRQGNVVGLAADGTVLVTQPGEAPGLAGLPLVSGWGPPRLETSLKVLAALSRYNIQSVVYTPTGIQAAWPGGSVWSGDLKSLLKYAGSIGMYPQHNLYIYPWGVSVQE